MRIYLIIELDVILLYHDMACILLYIRRWYVLKLSRDTIYVWNEIFTQEILIVDSDNFKLVRSR